LEDPPHHGIKVQTQDNEAEEEEQLDEEVLARRQGEHVDDKRTEMPVLAKDDREWRLGEDNCM
jgi:hypothetical protein